MADPSDSNPISFYAYNPSHIAPAIFSAVIAISLIVHIFQNFRYNFWRVTFLMLWGGLVFTAGWVMRVLSSYDPTNRNLYIAQTCLVLGGPPIYAAAEYNILGRLMFYVPMHAPFHPHRAVVVFLYLGALVESLTAAGAAMMAGSQGITVDKYELGGKLISISLVLQAVVEFVFISVISLIHRRAARAHMLTPNVRALCLMLYGTSSLVLIRCIARAIDSFATEKLSPTHCGSFCQFMISQEWYIYVFEAVPMAIYTIWLNIMHPGRYLPREKTRFLDIDSKTERLGPGWIDRRNRWETFVDPLDMMASIRGGPSHEKFWLRSEQYPIPVDGSFAQGTASNVDRALFGKKYRSLSMKHMRQESE